MKLILEKNILTDQQQDAVLSAKGADRRKLLQSYGKEIFGDDPDYAAFERSLVDSLDRYGTDSARNKFLTFLMKKDGARYGLDVEKADLLYRLFVNEESAVNSPASNFWLYDPKSYNGSMFKIKTLALLGSPEASQYGDKRKLKPIRQQILDTTDDAEIEKLLNKWAPENYDTGDADDVARKPKTKSTKNSISKADVAQFIKDAVESGEVKPGNFKSLATYLTTKG